MAAKTLATTLIGVRAPFIIPPVRSILFRPSLFLQRPIHTTQRASSPAAPPPAMANPPPASSPPPSSQVPPDTSHAAYLGEADSDNGFEAYKDAHGDPPPAVDGTNAAFLGEADSDDGFEANKEIHGQKLDALDASQSAYLGEADGDDGFESDVEINPEKYVHRFEDVSGSGLHGQSGEGDQ